MFLCTHIWGCSMILLPPTPLTSVLSPYFSVGHARSQSDLIMRSRPPPPRSLASRHRSLHCGKRGPSESERQRRKERMNANARRTRLGTFEFRRARFHRRAAACVQPRGGQTSDLSHADGFLPPKEPDLLVLYSYRRKWRQQSQICRMGLAQIM